MTESQKFFLVTEQNSYCCPVSTSYKEMSIFYVTKIYPTLPFFNTVYIFAFDRAVQYFDVTNKSSSFTVECVPEELEKKTTLLLYFARYMDEHLIQVSAMFFWKSEMNLVYRFRNKL